MNLRLLPLYKAPVSKSLSSHRFPSLSSPFQYISKHTRSTIRHTRQMSTPTKIRVALRGNAILTSPRFNKGTAFSLDERKAFGLTAHLPCRVNSLDEQCDRAWDQLNNRETPIRKNSFLQSLKEQNWVLYYELLARHLRELIPVIYTPTEVCPTYPPSYYYSKLMMLLGIGGCNRQLLPLIPPQRRDVPLFPQPRFNGRRLPRTD